MLPWVYEVSHGGFRILCASYVVALVRFAAKKAMDAPRGVACSVLARCLRLQYSPRRSQWILPASSCSICRPLNCWQDVPTRCITSRVGRVGGWEGMRRHGYPFQHCPDKIAVWRIGVIQLPALLHLHLHFLFGGIGSPAAAL